MMTDSLGARQKLWGLDIWVYVYAYSFEMGVEDAVIELYHIQKIQNQLQPMKYRFKFLLIHIF